ncbi:hypothetical protein HR060_07675 [Catenovulum sp. SM1970]|uniref:hypothetical protein n=1 Tax=Marinifaba aquimaris TaxID=2741323 RepID=UPI00157399A9|nr:hypothetical protein [Marinifaba aquimaris]NTS76747.1 hypothetical protein [Marinifaba aquimaris]
MVSEDKKLTVLFRIEPGSLGPTGGDHVEAFCPFAEDKLKALDSEFIIWKIVPRYDKSLDEVETSVRGKKLNMQQVDQYLQYFDKEWAEFEEHLADKLSELIDEFFDC